MALKLVQSLVTFGFEPEKVAMDFETFMCEMV